MDIFTVTFATFIENGPYRPTPLTDPIVSKQVTLISLRLKQTKKKKQNWALYVDRTYDLVWQAGVQGKSRFLKSLCSCIIN